MTPDDAQADNPLTDKQLDILHDHYKDTFTRLRESEQARDRLFLWLIALFAVLIVETSYPAAVGASLGKVTILSADLSLEALPLPALLNATWVLALVITLQYCRTTVGVNRQYPYLHALERRISPALGGGDLYQREGKVYLDRYQLLLDVAWFAYGIGFPVIAICAACVLAASEWLRLSYPLLHLLFDALLCVAIVTVLFLYRVQPALALKSKRFHQGA